MLDSKAWEALQRCAPLTGYEPWDPHAAAFAVYTSGTTGNPKGVLHEYGKLPRTYASMRWNGESFTNKADRFGYIPPMNFVAAIMGLVFPLVSETCYYIIPYSVSKNPEALLEYFLRHKISFTFLAPSFFRFINDLGPYLKKVVVSSEPANGLWRPLEEMTLWNTYGSSEAGTDVCVALLDHPNEIAPIGKPQYDVKVVILKADGSEAAPGEVGEFCYETPFTRGYINLPELTAQAFAGGLFHSGDLARWNEDGLIEIIGRCNDTVEINGNRVEPSEVENAIQRVTGLNWVGVRAFEEGQRAYLCAYHTEDTPFDIISLRERLKNLLPYYMLPSYFIRLDSIPRNANGKMDRRALPKPVAEDYRAEYAAPENEIQARLCRAMEEVLHLDRMGVDDDFYLLGGDSLASMRLLTAAELPALDISVVFKGRTARNIARLLESRQPGDWIDRDEANRAAMGRPHPLCVEQVYMFDYQLSAVKSTMNNLFQLFRIECIDPVALADALNRAISNHPSLLTEFFFDEDGEVMQRYRPDFAPNIKVEVLSREAWDALRDELVQPFRFIGSPLYRCRVFSVEGETHFFFDVHRFVFDGISFKVLLDNIERILSGERPLTDYYYYVLAQRVHERTGAFYLEALNYLRDRYTGSQWLYHLPQDYDSQGNEVGTIEMRLAVPESKYADTEAKTGLSKNGVFVAAGLLAFSRVSGANSVLLQWTYNGRDTLESMQSTGMLFNLMPAALQLTENTTLGEICAQIREQIEKAIEYRACPFVSLYPDPIIHTMVNIIYQDGTDGFKSGSGLLRMEQEKTRQNCETVAEASMDVEIWNDGDEKRVTLDYCASRYSPETIARFGKYFVASVEGITRLCGRLETSVRELFPE